jgi:hypothetical protein
MTNHRKTLVGIGFAILAIIMASQAFPQMIHLVSPLLQIPYTVDSVFVRYADTGSTLVESYMTSYQHEGREIVLLEFVPDHPLLTAVRRALDTFGFVTFHIIREFDRRYRQSNADMAIIMKNGCVSGRGQVIGRETILNYSTVAVQHDMGLQRITMWLASDLNCFALKMAIEGRRPDGSFLLQREKKALKVNTNR